MPLGRNAHHRETSQPMSIVNQLTGFQITQAATEAKHASNQTY